MKLASCIRKNHPAQVLTDIGSTSNFITKCMMENWIQMRNSTGIICAYPLPPKMMMANVEHFQFDESEHMSAVLKQDNSLHFITYHPNILESSVQCSITMDVEIRSQLLPLFPGNHSFLNIGVTLKSREGIANIFEVSDENTLRVVNTARLPYQPAENTSSIIECENLMYIYSQSIARFCLNEERIRQSINVSVGNELSEKIGFCNFKQGFDLICVYGQNWIGVADWRTGGMVNMWDSIGCSSVMKCSKNPFKMMVAKNDSVFQMDIRVNSMDRVLHHHGEIDRFHVNSSQNYLLLMGENDLNIYVYR